MHLRRPGNNPALSGEAAFGPFGASSLTVEGQLPATASHPGLDVCAVATHNLDIDSSRRAANLQTALVSEWQLPGHLEWVPFIAYTHGGESAEFPAVFSDGQYPIGLFRERALGTQNGARYDWHKTIAGAMVREDPKPGWRIEGGLFFSEERDPVNDYPYLLIKRNQRADSVFDVIPPVIYRGLSGEVRATRSVPAFGAIGSVEILARGRVTERAFGGDQVTDFGTISLLDPSQFARPPVQLGPEDHSKVHQLDVGATYRVVTSDVGSFSVGALSAHYNRRLQQPEQPTVTQASHPILINTRVTYRAIPTLTLYASYVQGLEDSPLAPSSATNRGELPPAARTTQVDGGMRWQPDPTLTVVAGTFEIQKPYFNLDSGGAYGILGRLRYTGVESSASWSSQGVTLLAGGVWLHPRAALNTPGESASSLVPIGPVPLTLTLNADYAPASWGHWSASAQVKSLSARRDTVDGSHQQPPLTTLDVGVRYQRKGSFGTWTLRADANNVADATGLHLMNSGLVLPEQGRRYSVTLSVDLTH